MKATTVHEFAAELEAAGCRIKWSKDNPESEFEATRRVNGQVRSVQVWFRIDGGLSAGAVTSFGGAWGLSPRRSMKAVREYLGVTR